MAHQPRQHQTYQTSSGASHKRWQWRHGNELGAAQQFISSSDHQHTQRITRAHVAPRALYNARSIAYRSRINEHIVLAARMTLSASTPRIIRNAASAHNSIVALTRQALNNINGAHVIPSRHRGAFYHLGSAHESTTRRAAHVLHQRHRTVKYRRGAAWRRGQ